MGSSVIIIGAGIAGLSTGCYARMNGYDTKIFERHDQPRGLCTAWDRKGYTMDGCLSWLVGSVHAGPHRGLLLNHCRSGVHRRRSADVPSAVQECAGASSLCGQRRALQEQLEPNNGDGSGTGVRRTWRPMAGGGSEEKSTATVMQEGRHIVASPYTTQVVFEVARMVSREKAPC